MFLTFLQVYFVERSSKPTRKFLRIIIRPEVHKEKVRRIRQHVAVKGSYFDTVSRKTLISGFTSLAISTKSPVIAALPPPVG